MVKEQRRLGAFHNFSFLQRRKYMYNMPCANQDVRQRGVSLILHEHLLCVRNLRQPTHCHKFYKFNMSVYADVNKTKIKANTGLTCPE